MKRARYLAGTAGSDPQLRRLGVCLPGCHTLTVTRLDRRPPPERSPFMRLTIAKAFLVAASAVAITAALGTAAAVPASAAPARSTPPAAVTTTGALTTLALPKAHAAAVRAAPQTSSVTIYLTNASSFCADVKDSDNVSGQPIWLFSCSSAGDKRWIPVEFSANCIIANPCYELQDAQDTSLCMSLDVSSNTIVLGRCNVGLAGWYAPGGNLLENEFSASSGYLTSDAASNGELLRGKTIHNGWQKWSGCCGYS
jgi:hypothetical protein